ncbi:SAM-dependent methyltransferase [Paractinoplanes brasiliensis]|uniref:S-adenosyl-L-methionine-dependent methyltransferase n=1 Tax=Paractinoplanes brasiliensis TaxID=52695 RepID=A0A4R6K0N7_9ACTN|nr:SAM-dependent methyltransferase [Actinoplanes brasiliensis]TDO41812.1 methyltransferase (TIGR00027 family) [Actinoplanes brasiliensis]GID29916.1 putative S-adenosyl-L-methionine-dependent methyltransferase [Actinoplanes brasiliensis]
MTDGREQLLKPGIGAKSLDGTFARALESQRADALIDDFLAAVFLRRGVTEGVLEPSVLDEDGRPLDPGSRNTSAWFVRARHVGLRSWFGDRVIEEAVTSGVRQVVILAAGQDARAYRLIEEPDCVVFEVDQPEVTAFNSRALAGLDARPRCERRPVSADLASDWRGPLVARGWQASRPTVWVIEGVLIYLPPDVREALFRDITALSAAGSYLSLDDAPLEELRGVQRVLDAPGAARDEHSPAMFDMRPRAASAQLLQSLGWQAQAITADALRTRHGLPGESSGNPLASILGRCHVVSARYAG